MEHAIRGPWRLLGFGLLLTSFLPFSLQGQNLLVNGDFEQPDRTTIPSYNAGGDFSYITLPQTIPGWTFNNSIDLYGPLNGPENGSQYLDLVGGGPLAVTFTLQQTFSTIAGNGYRLDFFYANNEETTENGVPATFTASLTGASTIWTQDFSHSGDTTHNHQWTEFTVDWVADSSSTTLLYTDTTHLPASYDANATDAGAQLDNVSVIGTAPEMSGSTIAWLTLGIIFIAIVQQGRCRRRLARKHN